MLRDDMQLCAPFSCPVVKHFKRRIGLGDAVGWDTVLEYTSFMPGDAVNRVTEKCLMVDAKACDTSHRRLGQNISSVVLTAYATFLSLIHISEPTRRS